MVKYTLSTIQKIYFKRFHQLRIIVKHKHVINCNISPWKGQNYFDNYITCSNSRTVSSVFTLGQSFIVYFSTQCNSTTFNAVSEITYFRTMLIATLIFKKIAANLKTMKFPRAFFLFEGRKSFASLTMLPSCSARYPIVKSAFYLSVQLALVD